MTDQKGRVASGSNGRITCIFSVRNGAIVFATVAVKQAMRTLNDKNMKPLLLEVALLDAAPPHLSREPICKKPFRAYRKCSLSVSRNADWPPRDSSPLWPRDHQTRSSSRFENPPAHSNQIRPQEDGKRYRHGRPPAAKNPNPPIPSTAFAHHNRQLAPIAPCDRAHRRR